MAYVHVLVKLAVRRGELKRPLICDGCGLLRATWAHHDDYAKPLEVRWLCKPCHAEWHRLNGPGLNVEIADLHPAKTHPVIKPKPQRKEKGPDKRFDDMAALISAGWTLQMVGDKYGLSRERVRQIVGSPHEYRPDKADMAKDHASEVMEYRAQGRSVKEISKLTGLTAYQIKVVGVSGRVERPIVHGKPSSYNNRKCRCSACTKAATDRMRNYMRKRREMETKGRAA